MNNLSWKTLLVFAAVAFSVGAAEKKDTLSLKKEIQQALDKGSVWLEKAQNTNGYWQTGDTPAITAMALFALQANPGSRSGSLETLQKGYAYLEGCLHEDGSIYKKKELLTHNTALSVMAFVAAKNPKYDPIIRKGRGFLIGLQTDFDKKAETDNIFDGGVGYGSHYDHSDMANTVSALEALYYSKQQAKDKPNQNEPDLNWAVAIHFLQNCQNLPGYNKQEWVSDDAKNKGGFVYFPGQSAAGTETNAAGRVALRSYGSASYSGMLSYIYADLKPNDPRVLAVFSWLQQNFTLEENPGMGQQGLYYYYQLMTKALTAANVKTIHATDGKEINWRKELASRLIAAQKADGSWSSETGRWREKEPEVVTSYVLMALAQIHHGLN